MNLSIHHIWTQRENDKNKKKGRYYWFKDIIVYSYVIQWLLDSLLLGALTNSSYIGSLMREVIKEFNIVKIFKLAHISSKNSWFVKYKEDWRKQRNKIPEKEFSVINKKK